MDTVDIKIVKYQADLLGLKYHHRAGAEKIAGMVASHLAAHPEDALKLIPEDKFAQNQTIETEADQIIDFSETNPFGIP